ncbi:zinc finger protein 485-like [Hetaerina americana]|uniref:zinc finger protein 485-like n=1 Tax=Hetaerina americana TaxID=62018 RepID=UPI003A7F1ABD
MDLKNSERLCRLCLCNSSRVIDVLEENGDLGFAVAKTIEDLLQFKVRKLGNYSWLACSTCLEKLIEFRLFKSRCIDSNITFEKRFCQFHSDQFGPNDDIQAEPNEPGTSETWRNSNETVDLVMSRIDADEELISSRRIPGIKTENAGLEGEKIVEFKKETQGAEENDLINPEEEPNEPGTSETWRNSNETVDLVMSRIDADEELISSRRIPGIKTENAGLEGEKIVDFKKETQGAEENDLINPEEAPNETGIKESLLKGNKEFGIRHNGPKMAERKISDRLTSGRAWHNSDETMNLVMCRTDADEEQTASRRVSNVKPQSANLEGAPEKFGDSALHRESQLLDSRFRGVHASANGGNKMLAAGEGMPCSSSKQSSYELEGGRFNMRERLRCIYCDAVFVSESSLQVHVMEHQEGRLGRDSGKAHAPNASQSDEEGDGLNGSSSPMNLSMKTSDRSNAVTAPGDSTPAPLEQNDQSFECKKCFRVFSYFQTFKNHEISCVDTNKCYRCNKSFAKSYLYLHMKASKSNETFSCSKCKKSFKFKCELIAHRQVHTKIFMCKDCECFFSRYYHLREHMMVHCKVKPLVCRGCNETFIGSHALRKHKLEVHNGR